MKTYLLMIGVIIVDISLVKATVSVEEVIVGMVQDQRQGKVKSSAPNVLFEPRNLPLAINTFLKYTNDTLPNVRYLAFEYIALLGQKSNEVNTRKNAILTLLAGTKDGYIPVVTLAWEQLLKFGQGDFVGAPTDYFINYPPSITLKPELWAKTIGFLQLKSKEGDLISLINSDIPKKAKWKVHLSLSRLGNSKSTEYLLDQIKKIPINDEWINSLLPDLVYTRSKLVFNFLFQIIQSKEDNCMSQNPDSESNIPCGYRVVEAIAPTIKSFPAKVDPSGDLIGNCSVVLKETREWIIKIKDGYSFVN
jgi:hypothetical protein